MMHFYDDELAGLSMGYAGAVGQLPSGPGEPQPEEKACDPGFVYNFGTGLCDAAVGFCEPDADGTQYIYNPSTDQCDPLTGPGGAALPPGFVAPGKVPVRCDRWDGDQYRLASGDTYVGLAKAYLGDGSRWREIWDLNRDLHPNPSVIFVGQVITMPSEAEAKCGGIVPTLKKALPWIAIGVGAVVVGSLLLGKKR